VEIQSEEAVGPPDETVLIWSRRNASWASLFFATMVTVIAVAHAFFLSRPSFAFLMLGGIFTFGALVWGKRAILPTEAVRITADGILDRTSPIGTERMIPWSQIHDVHLQNGQLGLDVIDAPAPSLLERFDKFFRNARGNYFIGANHLAIPAGDVFDLLDRRIQQRLLDASRDDARSVISPGNDI